ncbi:MAG TPA: hypothetical protein VFL15_10800 [Gammaproteobacteria bacterium]|nr:hypothetical protein [Gammaproteobacteria bacterium]
MHQRLRQSRHQTPYNRAGSLIPGCYEYADGWNDRALYVRVNYLPLQSLHVELYIDHSKMQPDVELRVSLAAESARFMSQISAGQAGWPCHGCGVGTLLANCAIVFLKAIYPPQALLTGWAPPLEVTLGENSEVARDRRLRFWARFGVLLDDYNMFGVNIGELIEANDGRSCLDYFPRLLPVSAFRYLGSTARQFPLGSNRGGTPSGSG